MSKEKLLNKLSELSIYLQKELNVYLDYNIEHTQDGVVGVITTADGEINLSSLVFTTTGETYLYYSDNEAIKKLLLDYSGYKIVPAQICIVGNGGV